MIVILNCQRAIPMRKLVLEQWISADGFAEDKNGKLDYFPTNEDNMLSDRKQLEFLETVDTMLLGRKTYEMFVDFWPNATTDVEIIADRLNSLDKVVVSNSLKSAPWGKWPDAQIATGDGLDAIRKLKTQKGKDIVLWGSISLAQALLDVNLVDELRLNICPVLVGGGRPLFPELEEYKKLKLIEQRSYDSGVVFLRYET